MGLFPGLSTGASSMQNASDQIQVIGNNLANVSTPGFKRSRALTNDAFYSTLTGSLNQQIGHGANHVAVQRIVTEGSTRATGNALDMAIGGGGFFVLSDPVNSNQFFTRDGSFTLDNTNTLIHNGTGNFVQGFPVTNGGVGTTAANITVPSGVNVGTATTAVSFQGNLDATASILGTAGSFRSAAIQDAFQVVTGTNDQIVFELSGGAGPITASLTTDGGLASGTTVNGTAVAAALKTALEATNASGDTYTVTYDQAGDTFKIINPLGNSNALTLRNSNAASTASGLLGFIASDSNAIPPAGQIVSDAGVAFNILTGLNDTLNLTIDGTPITITVPAGNYTGAELAFQIERQIQAAPGDFEGSAVTYDAVGTSDRFNIIGPRTGGSYTINQPSNTGTPTIAVTGTATTVTGGTMFNPFAFNTGTALAGTGQFDASDPFKTSTDNTTVDIIDSLGEIHSLTIFFRKVGNNQWEWHGAMKGADLTTTTPATSFEEVVSGRVLYNSDGLLETETTTAGSGVFNMAAVGAPPIPVPAPGQAITFDFGTSIVTDGGTGDDGMVQFGADPDQKAVSLTSFITDGVPKGAFESLQVTAQGDINVRFTNGVTTTIGRLALALFNSAESLSAVSDNLFVETADSGTAIIAQPNTVGTGKIIPDSLETSNVELASEFVELILAQQIFQANARLITTSDEILQTLSNI